MHTTPCVIEYMCFDDNCDKARSYMDTNLFYVVCQRDSNFLEQFFHELDNTHTLLHSLSNFNTNLVVETMI